MKKHLYILIGVAAMMVAACGQNTVVEKTQSEQLAERLQTLQAKGYMMGHQDDPMYGVTWMGTYRGSKNARIDYIFHDESLKGLTYYTQDLNYSDHYPVYMKVEY